MPRPKEFTVRLTAAARMISRARVLLALDESQGDAPDRRVVAERVGTSESTVYLVAKAFATQGGGVEEVIGRKKRATPPVEPKVTGDVEARLMSRWRAANRRRGVRAGRCDCSCSQMPGLARQPGRGRSPVRTLNTSATGPTRSSCGANPYATGAAPTPSRPGPASTEPTASTIC